MTSFIDRQAQAWSIMAHRWEGNETCNGPGSTMLLTQEIRKRLPGIFKEYNIKTILDCPCGDWAWFKHVDLAGIDYLGWDVEPGIVRRNKDRFGVGDGGVAFENVNALTRSLWPAVDLVIARDFFLHLPTAYALIVLEKIKLSGSKYLLTGTWPGVSNDRDCPLGGGMDGVQAYYARPLDLAAHPFGLGEPLLSFQEAQANVPEWHDDGGEIEGRIGPVDHVLYKL
jgi:hypothetical protein